MQYVAVDSQSPLTGDMDTLRIAMFTLRIEPELKQALCTAAKQEHRPIANMVAVLIRDYC